MPTRCIDKSSSPAELYTGSHAGIGVDSDTNKLIFNPDGTKREVVDTVSTASLAGKTVTGPVAVETVAATNVITAAESGTTYFLSHATEFVSTLPLPAAGLKFSFVVANAPETASYTVFSSGGANIIVGHVIVIADAAGDLETSGGDTVSFVDGQAVVGDRADFISDGTNWFVTAVASVAAGITITTAA